MSYVDEMYNKGIEVKKACYYSGINRITYYYRKRHESIEDNRHGAGIDSSIVDKIIDNTHLFFSKIGKIRMFQHRKINGKIKQATIKKNKADNYYVTFIVEESADNINCSEE